MDNRIDLIAKLCSNRKMAVDIGSDHAYVLINAITNYNLAHGIASDIGIGPLNNAKSNIKEYNLENKIDCVLSDGFTNITSDFDTAVIAGMGGVLIANILLQALSKLNDALLILEPNKDSYILRKMLVDNDFLITDEFDVSVKGHYYPVILAQKGFNEKKYSEIELEYGPYLIKKRSDLFISFYTKKLNVLRNSINSVNDKTKQEELNLKISKLEFILEVNK